MTDAEAKFQEKRIANFNRLAAIRSALYSARSKMDEKSHEPGSVPSHSSPFTGNTRESRDIAWIRIGFTATLGGEPSREIELNPLGIPAYALGHAIEKLIEARLARLNAEIKTL